jgi:hypothetical protein
MCADGWLVDRHLGSKTLDDGFFLIALLPAANEREQQDEQDA